MAGSRTVVVEVKLHSVPSRVDEVIAMANSIGYEIIDRVVQNRNGIDPGFTIGRGKLLELKQIVEEKKIDLLIFTNTLPSPHVFKIQQKVGNDVKVIDRNLLILELFGKRAMTSEAKLQIQLAHLKYTFTWGRQFLRLTGILGEQVGWSGPENIPIRTMKEQQRNELATLKRSSQEYIRRKTFSEEDATN